jgi:hypothetical protein
LGSWWSIDRSDGNLSSHVQQAIVGIAALVEQRHGYFRLSTLCGVVENFLRVVSICRLLLFIDVFQMTAFCDPESLRKPLLMIRQLQVGNQLRGLLGVAGLHRDENILQHRFQSVRGFRIRSVCGYRLRCRNARGPSETFVRKQNTEKQDDAHTRQTRTSHGHLPQKNRSWRPQSLRNESVSLISQSTVEITGAAQLGRIEATLGFGSRSFDHATIPPLRTGRAPVGMTTQEIICRRLGRSRGGSGGGRSRPRRCG